MKKMLSNDYFLCTLLEIAAKAKNVCNIFGKIKNRISVIHINLSSVSTNTVII